MPTGSQAAHQKKRGVVAPPLTRKLSLTDLSPEAAGSQPTTPFTPPGEEQQTPATVPLSWDQLPDSVLRAASSAGGFPKPRPAQTPPTAPRRHPPSPRSTTALIQATLVRDGGIVATKSKAARPQLTIRTPPTEHPSSPSPRSKARASQAGSPGQWAQPDRKQHSSKQDTYRNLK